LSDGLEIEKEYARCITSLNRSNITVHLPKSGSIGVIGADGKEYPIPTKEKVTELFARNRENADRKVLQGFDSLLLTPVAMPTLNLIDLMREAIIKHGKERNIYQTRLSAYDPLMHVRVNKEKQVWVWETLGKAIETDELVYFPQEYSFSNHRGQTKSEVINNERICAVPGWSIGLVENLLIMPKQGQGITLGGRKQLEIGYSPFEYLQMIQMKAYYGETGKILEDFITQFLTHLEVTNEVSNDVDDKNALWCLGQYMKISYAEVVPTGRWHRSIGRVRLDMHRTKNKQCTQNWGASTVVRLF
jgi:hypothetical protein